MLLTHSPESGVTAYGLLRAARRQWPATVVGLVATVLAAWVTAHPAPVFYAQTNAIFLAPVSQAYPNSLVVTSASLIDTASLVQRSVAGPSRVNKASSATVTLYDRGIYDGSAIELPDTGGQWATNFDSPLLSLQATGSDPAAVSAKIATMQRDVIDELQRRQVQAKVREVNRIRITMSPAEVPVRQVTGSRTRALAIGLALGVGGTIALVGVVDRLRRVRRGTS